MASCNLRMKCGMRSSMIICCNIPVAYASAKLAKRERERVVLGQLQLLLGL